MAVCIVLTIEVYAKRHHHIIFYSQSTEESDCILAFVLHWFCKENRSDVDDPYLGHP